MLLTGMFDADVRARVERQMARLTRLLDDHATGYTVIDGVSGFGHHGRREGDLVMVLTVVTKEHAEPVLDGAIAMLNARSGVACISDVAVMRGEYFTPECRDRAMRALPDF